MPWNKLIFVAGIHGVGKGTICNKYSEQYNIRHLSSSQLLRWNEVSENPKEKRVVDFDDTQVRLLDGLEKNTKATISYLLDGHFCLFDTNGLPKPISSEVYQAISPDAIAIVTGDSSNIKKRLEVRDGVQHDARLLEKMQNLEIERGEEIANQLGVPLFLIKESISLGFELFLRAELG